jgi:beta-lactam-binding protein with PASTA domain
VVALEDGVSVFSGTATVTNSNIRNILSNFPEVDVEGDQVTVSNIEFKITDKGIESVNGLATGTIVEYDAKVGDEYKTSDGVRKVISRSSEDDYMYGFFLIKVIEVEENLNKYGVKKIKYWANHRFGLVDIEFTYDDNSTSKFPVYSSAEN